jgi:hypothetical protein
LRIDDEGNIELADCQNSFYQWNGNRFFKYVQIVGMAWQTMFFAKKILTQAGYTLGINYYFNLVGTKDSFLDEFSQEKGEDGKWWLNPFDPGYLHHDPQTHIRSIDPNIQLTYKLSITNVGEKSSKDIVNQIAEKLGQAYNHQSKPRCFNHNTDIFPWQQYLSGRK